jgi:hypothetical protein
MSKLKCLCGHTIVDQANNLRYKADFLPDQNREDFWTDIVNIIKDFNDAKEKGEKENWMKENFTVPPYPIDLPDQEMIWDLIHNSFVDKTRTMFQCETCGRILIQEKGSERFITFKPDNDDWTNLLNP